MPKQPVIPRVWPYIAIKRVPFGNNLAEEFDNPISVIRSSVSKINPSFSSPVLTHGMSPSQYSGYSLLGVPPLARRATNLILFASQDEGIMPIQSIPLSFMDALKLSPFVTALLITARRYSSSLSIACRCRVMASSIGAHRASKKDTIERRTSAGGKTTYASLRILWFTLKSLTSTS